MATLYASDAPARPGAAAAAAAEDAAGYAAQTAYGGELKGAYSAAGASSPRADPAPSPDAPAPPRWPDAPGYGAPAAVVHAPLVGARHAYEPAAELVPAVAEVEAAANGDAHTAAHDESAPHAEHVQPPQFETQLRHEHEAPRHPEAHASQERQQRRTEAAEEQPRPAPTRAGYGMPLGRRYNGEAAEAEVVQPEADEPREHQEQEPALKSESEREQEAVPEPEQRPAAAYDEPQQQGMEASPAAEAEEGAEPEEAEEPDEAAEPEDEAEAAGSTPPSPTPLSPSALSPQQRAGWQPFCPAPRPFTNPLGSSKGSLMGLVAPNPKAEVVRATDVIEEVRAPSYRVSDMSKQLRNAFEKGMPFGGIGVHPDLDKSGRGAAAMAASAAPAGPTRASGVKEHDLVNTANVAQVLQAGEFRLRPGVDFVGYDELKELRLEDGLDVSRKEEYLAEEEFESVFGMDKEDFRAMPPWKRINAKKSKGLF